MSIACKVRCNEDGWILSSTTADEVYIFISLKEVSSLSFLPHFIAPSGRKTNVKSAQRHVRPRDEGKSSAPKCMAREGRGNKADDEGKSSNTECKVREGERRWGKRGSITKERSLHKHVKPRRGERNSVSEHNTLTSRHLGSSFLHLSVSHVVELWSPSSSASPSCKDLLHLDEIPRMNVRRKTKGTRAQRHVRPTDEGRNFSKER